MGWPPQAPPPPIIRRESPIRTSAWTSPLEPVVRTSSCAAKARFTNSISSIACLTGRYGMTLCTLSWVPRIVVWIIADLLERSAPSRALKSGRGRSRRSLARLTRSASSGSPDGGTARGAASSPSSVSASPSMRASSLMDVPHACSEALECAELELLHRALRALELPGDLANALLLDEALDHDIPLVVGQAADEIGEQDPPVDVDHVPVVVRIWRRLTTLARRALPPVGQGVARDPEEPRDERDAPPLEPPEVGERVVKHVGGQVLRLSAVADAPGDERIHAVDVPLVQGPEAAGVGLRGLDQEALVL